MNSFIHSLNLDTIAPMAGDVSRRRYFLASKDGRDSLIMLYPDASQEDQEELNCFIKIGDWLAEKGLHVPQIYGHDMALTTAHVECLSDQSFGDIHRSGEGMDAYYALATDVLREISMAPAPDFVQPFKGSKVDSRLPQFLEYYAPYATGRKLTDEQRAGFWNAWQEMEAALPACTQTLQLMDAHLENMMLCADEEGLRRCGLIDYQDAAIGPMPYDLVNLLEDARVDVAPALKAAMVDRFCAGMSAEERAVFDAWYAVMALHFHARVSGLFIKLAVDDARDAYLVHMPRLERYMRVKLDHPALWPVMDWCRAQGLDFDTQKAFDGDALREQFSSFVIPSEVEGSSQ